LNLAGESAAPATAAISSWDIQCGALLLLLLIFWPAEKTIKKPEVSGNYFYFLVKQII